MRARRQLQSLLVAARHDPFGLLADAKLARASLRHDAVQKVTELTPLIALARSRHPRRIVEIGTERGGTLVVWAEIAPAEALIVSVDWPEAAVKELPAPETLRALARPGQRLELVRENSQSAETQAMVAGILDGPVDLLYIDGDHSYEGARRDFELYAPLVRDGGLIAFHDVAHHRPETGCDVERLWNELKPRYRHWEFLDPDSQPDLGFGPWGGIGVLEYAARAAA